MDKQSIDLMMDYAVQNGAKNITQVSMKDDGDTIQGTFTDEDKFMYVTMKDKVLSHTIQCMHDYRATVHNDVESCIGVICIKCGHLSCGCSAHTPMDLLLERSSVDGCFYVGDEYYAKFHK